MNQGGIGEQSEAAGRCTGLAGRAGRAAAGRDDDVAAYAHIALRAVQADGAACFGAACGADAALGQYLAARGVARLLADVYIFDGAQHHFAAFQTGALGTNDAAVAQAARKNADCIALQVAQVGGFVVGPLDDELNALQAPPGYLDLLACAQDDVAVVGADNSTGTGGDLGGQEHDVAVGRADAAVYLHTAREAIALEFDAPSGVVGIAGVEGAGGKACGVNHTATAHGNAVLVNQNDVAVRR